MTENTFGQGTPNDNAFPAPETLSYEQARDQLIETVKILELGQMSLDESLKYWERGEALAKRCEVLLNAPRSVSKLHLAVPQELPRKSKEELPRKRRRQPSRKKMLGSRRRR